MQLVEEARAEVLANGSGSATDADILALCCFSSPFEGGMNAVGDEVEGRSAVHHERFACVVGEHEHWHVIGRGLAPPAFPAVVGPGAADWPEHIAADNPGAEVLEAAPGEVVVDVLSCSGVTAGRAGFSEHFLERLRTEDPIVQRHAPATHRIFETLLGTGTVAVDGDSNCVHS